VIVPDYNEPLFKFLTDLKHLRTEYQHYTESRYIEEYNEIPQNPRDSGLDYIKTDYANYDHIGSIPTHTRTVRKKEEVYLLGSIGLIGFIKGKLTCSEEYYVIAELKVLSSVEPFNIYLPKEYDAFLDLQPYIVIPLQLPEINTKSTDAEDNIFDDPIEQKVSSITTTTKTKPLLEII
ncbi:MAG: hypothetical protein U9O98_11710, partial [Asgard group archaeon]|nr:hypothetical protein [Asgard group archaeon]